MNLRQGLRACSISTLCLSLCAQHSSAAFFVPLGNLSGDSYSRAADVSADGSVVVGVKGGGGSSESLGSDAFRWTSAGGMIGIGHIPDHVGSFATAVSADGSVVAGSSIRGFARSEAFRWTEESGMVGLGMQPGNADSIATAVSADGLVVVGGSFTYFFGGVRPALRWTRGGGMTDLGDLPGGDVNSYADDVSADGSVVVGASSAGGSPPDSEYFLHAEAFRWTSGGGMTGLGNLTGGDFDSRATGVSADGSVIVGYSDISADYQREAFRWTSAGGMVGLGDLPGGRHSSFAEDISADATIIVGRSDSSQGELAFVWDATNGMRNVSDVLAGLGVDLTGWTLSAATAISADGTTIVGYGTNPSGRTEAWLAKISAVPEPPTASIVLVFATTLASGIRVSWRSRQR